jgi:hypothetical protein
MTDEPSSTKRLLLSQADPAALLRAVTSGEPSDTPVTPPDPFDLESLCLSQDFIETAGVKKLLRVIPVRKPGTQDFVRVHSDPAYRRNILCIDIKDDREEYLVRPEIAPELVGETVMKTIFTAITRQGTVFMWPCRIPPPDAKDLVWWSSMREAATEATKTWIRVRANMNLGAYEMAAAEGKIPDPVWPRETFQELLRIAYRDKMIDRVDHPVIRRLRGLT